VAKLDKYREMRDFEATPEPSGDEPATGSADGQPRFVVQEHHATALHWDLRLERDGVLVSWAVPKGIPPDPRVNHLAVQTEDHPLMYLDFHGDIPEGSYGAGRMTVWDTGTYDLHEWTDRKVEVTLHGERARGLYVLFQTRGNQWMIHRKDPPEDPTRELMPTDLKPMVATKGKVPKDEDEYALEIRWEGARTLIASDGGRLEFAIGVEKTPELRLMGRHLGAVQVVLDGVLVAFDENGRPNRDRLQQRMALEKDNAIRRATKSTPITFIAFDVVWMEGHPTTELSYVERRKLLDELHLHGPNWQSPAFHEGDGRALLEAATQQGLSGVVAKRLDSTYQPGATTTDWIDIPAEP
jgi:bifunctional non-homologous end joining protein LigD